MTPAMTMAIYAVGLVSSKLIALGLQPFVTQWLGADQFGQLDVLVTFGSLLTLIMAFGISDAMYRFAHDQADQAAFFRCTFGLILLIASVIMLLGQAFLSELQQILPGAPSSFAVRCLLLTLLLNTLCCVPLAILRIRNLASQFVLAQVAFALVQGLGIIFLAPQYGVDGIMAAGLVAQIVQIITLAKHFPAPKLGLSALLLKYGRAITLSGILSFLVMGVERWAIADTLGLAALAPYAIAAQWAIAASLLLEPFGMWWFPKRFGLLGTQAQRQQAATLSVLGCQLGCLVAAGIIIVGSRFLLLWLPAEFHQSAQILPLLGITVMFKHASTLLNIGCYHQKDGNSIMAIGMISAACAIALLVFVLPRFGLYPFILAGIGLQLLRVSLFYLWSQHYLRLPYPLPRLAVSYALVALILVSHIHFKVAYEIAFSLLLLVQVGWPWLRPKLTGWKKAAEANG
ncbi:polysaccharide biosynthesis family protein [Photobacterium rosenbergii]|uniref:Polysaccharide biosynthesis family protein n=1 Tax=Photobacterium rosenbergii TaxID=294936 RepID=A0A2T3ND00_9GAMM|nr:oligosaccharide flippase family protein [Photobacterium rosenbergii]PSW11961.1 polysaccharide biosynthesis family protein [Photobacterium rosenbergii]